MKIKFCTIEYIAKRLWKYKKGKPNYLCDPNTEIDPTSFGCWTSALHGEHLPGGFLRFGKHYKNKIFIKIHVLLEKILGKKIYQNINYLKNFDVLLFLIHDFDFKSVLEIIKQTKQVNPRALFLGSLASCPGLIRQAIRGTKNFRMFVKFIQEIDLMINVYPEVQDYFEMINELQKNQGSFMKISESKIIPFLQFYPVNFVKKFKKDYPAKKKIIHLAGPTDREDNLANQYVAVALQRKFPQFLITINNWENLNIEPLKKAQARFKVLPQMKWQDYLAELAHSFLVLNLDNIWTLGRVTADCAAVGTPCIGINASNQFRMFPKLRVEDMMGIKQAVEIGQKLIEEHIFYEEVVKYAGEKIEEHKYNRRREELIRILKEITSINKQE